MKIELEINNVTQSPVEETFLQEVADQTFANLETDFGNAEFSVSIAFVNEEEIKKLNGQYRQYDKVTDILSFAEHESMEEIEKVAKEMPGELFLGELILCYDDIKQYAQEENLNFEHELAKTISHGFLHLLGYDHGEKMFAIQEDVAQIITKK